MDDYSLRCDVCSTFEFVKDRKIFKVEITEILEADRGSTYPHKDGDVRFIQICEHCFKDSDINKILINNARRFKGLDQN